jgi:hypothetical protein
MEFWRIYFKGPSPTAGVKFFKIPAVEESAGGEYRSL